MRSLVAERGKGDPCKQARPRTHLQVALLDLGVGPKHRRTNIQPTLETKHLSELSRGKIWHWRAVIEEVEMDVRR